jgi:predicted transposase YdaD
MFMRYLVSLNKDEAFKKVFKELPIAKAFLEDLLNVKIQEIEHLERDNKMTDAAAIVRFDFRCRIDDRDVIIEMQQDNFNYLVKRFYLYHCLSTGLQLEVILKKAADKAEKEKIALLKAEKEKQEQLLKAKEVETRLKIVQKMLNKGNSVETIAELLDLSIEQVQECIHNLSK